MSWRDTDLVRTTSWSSGNVRKEMSSGWSSTPARTRRSASSSKACLYTKYLLIMLYFGYSR